MKKYNWESTGPGGCDSHCIEHPCGPCKTGFSTPEEAQASEDIKSILVIQKLIDELRNARALLREIDQEHGVLADSDRAAFLDYESAIMRGERRLKELRT